MGKQRATSPKSPERNIWSALAVYLFFFAAVVRTVVWITDRDKVLLFLILEGAFLLLMTWMIWFPGRNPAVHHASLVAQVLILALLQTTLPQEDFTNVLWILVAYQVGLLFEGRVFLGWGAVILLMTWIALMSTQGALVGTAKSLLNVAGGLIVLAFFLASREVNQARRQREQILAQLKETNEKLKAYATQVEELSTLDERNRLARELHDSVSQTLFSITLSTKAAQLLLQKNPKKLGNQLEQLQQLTEGALAEIRTMITQLRPQKD